MTYFSYLLGFVILPLVVLVGIIWRESRQRPPGPSFHGSWAVPAGVGLLALLALVYTTPWDNYLVASGIWSYRRDLISGIVLGWVPIEEYLFFILETILIGAVWQLIAPRIKHQSPFRSSLAMRIGGTAALAAAWLAGLLLLISGGQHGRYLGLILVWALPVLALQFAFGADILWHSRRLVSLTVLIVTFYLSATDRLAILSGTWAIDPVQSTGILIAGLPLEEAVFFFITALIVACGLTLFLSRESSLRWESSILPFLQRAFRHPTKHRPLQTGERGASSR